MDKFNVYNDSALIEHTEGEKLETGEVPVTISGLTPSTLYDKINVAYVGTDDKTPVPEFTTEASS